MDTATQEIYFQKLQELIEDEDKIVRNMFTNFQLSYSLFQGLFQVTVSSLASALEISVQDSSNILNQYFADNTGLKPDSLTATFILAGNLKNSQGKAFRLVKNSDVNSKKEEFEENFSQILYSIQKSKDIDVNVLALVDWPKLNLGENGKHL